MDVCVGGGGGGGGGGILVEMTVMVHVPQQLMRAVCLHLL